MRKVSLFCVLLFMCFAPLLASGKGIKATSTFEKVEKSDSIILKRVLDKVFSLPEVRRQDSHLDSLSKHKRRVSMRVMESPSAGKPYYVIAVGDDNQFRFETYYNFYVWPKGMIVKYMDPISGEVISLEQWRGLSGH